MVLLSVVGHGCGSRGSPYCTTGRISCVCGDTNMPPPLSSPVVTPVPRALPSRCNVAVVSHAQYVLTFTAAPASCIKAAVNKAAR